MSPVLLLDMRSVIFVAGPTWIEIGAGRKTIKDQRGVVICHPQCVPAE
jgi:hypothetical protein